MGSYNFRYKNLRVLLINEHAVLPGLPQLRDGMCETKVPL